MSAMNAIGQMFELFALILIEQFFEVLQEEFAAYQLSKLFLLFNHTLILFFDTTKGVEVLGMDNLSKDAHVEQSATINSCDLLGETLDKAEQFLQAIIGEHVDDP